MVKDLTQKLHLVVNFYVSHLPLLDYYFTKCLIMGPELYMQKIFFQVPNLYFCGAKFL